MDESKVFESAVDNFFQMSANEFPNEPVIVSANQPSGAFPSICCAAAGCGQVGAAYALREQTGTPFMLNTKLPDSAAPPASPQSSVVGPSLHSSDVSLTDWRDLFNAVLTRLRATAVEAGAEPVGSGMRAAVLECVAALDQLHGTLTHAVDRCQQLDRDVLDAQIALQQLRAEQAAYLATDMTQHAADKTADGAAGPQADGRFG